MPRLQWPATRTAPDRVVQVGQTVAVRSEDFDGEIVFLSYAHTAAGARLTIFGPQLGSMSPGAR